MHQMHFEALVAVQESLWEGPQGLQRRSLSLDQCNLLQLRQAHDSTMMCPEAASIL